MLGIVLPGGRGARTALRLLVESHTSMVNQVETTRHPDDRSLDTDARRLIESSEYT